MSRQADSTSDARIAPAVLRPRTLESSFEKPLAGVPPDDGSARPPLRPYLLAGFAVSLVLLAFFGPTALRGQAITEGEGVWFYMPLREAVAAAWREGRWPMWNPYVYGGMPLLADCQAGAFYPLNLLYMCLPPVAALNLVALLGEWMACWGMIALLRDHRVSAWGAAVGAVSFALSGPLVAHLGHISIVNAAVWMPWICLVVRRWCLEGRRRWLVAGTLLWAVQFMAGHPQMVVYTGMLAGMLVISLHVRGRRHVRRGLAGLAVIGLIAVLLCAVQILPTHSLSTQTGRNLTPSIEIFRKYRLTLVNTPLLWLPCLYGTQGATPLNWSWWGDWNFVEQAGYVGLLPWMLLPAAACLPGGRARMGRAWAIIAALHLALAWNIETPLGYLLFRVPVYNAFESAGRHLFGMVLSLSMIAGIGLDALRDARPPAAHRWSRRGACAVLLLVGAIAFAAVWGYEYAIVHLDYGLGVASPRLAWSQHAWIRAPWVLVGPLLMAAASAVALRRFAAQRSFTSRLLLLGVLLADVGAAAYLGAWRWRPDSTTELQPPPGEIAALLSSHGEAGSPPPRYLIFGGRLSESALNPQANMRYRLACMNGYGPFQFRRFRRMLGEMNHDGIVKNGALLEPGRSLDLWACRYVVFHPDAASTASLTPGHFAGYQPVLRTDSLEIWENRDALPHARRVERAIVLGSDEAVLHAIQSGDLPDGRPFRSEEVALVSSEQEHAALSAAQGPGAPAADRRVEWKAYLPGLMVLEASSESPGILVIAEPFIEGWQAWVDGSPAALVPVDYMLQGVPLPAGIHRVELRYRPPSLRYGLLGSGAGVLALALLIAGALRRHRLTFKANATSVAAAGR